MNNSLAQVDDGCGGDWDSRRGSNQAGDDRCLGDGWNRNRDTGDGQNRWDSESGGRRGEGGHYRWDQGSQSGRATTNDGSLGRGISGRGSGSSRDDGCSGRADCGGVLWWVGDVSENESSDVLAIANTSKVVVVSSSWLTLENEGSLVTVRDGGRETAGSALGVEFFTERIDWRCSGNATMSGVTLGVLLDRDALLGSKAVASWRLCVDRQNEGKQSQEDGEQHDGEFGHGDEKSDKV